MRSPFGLKRVGLRKLLSFAEALKEFYKRPPIGVTQGGSSRRNRGAKPAATDGTNPANMQEKEYKQWLKLPPR